MSPKTKTPDFSDFPPGIGQPALRALAGAGYTRLEQLTRAREADLLQLHGFGPKALRLLAAALASRGKSFAPARRD
jgi:hypothetical protein